VIEGNLGMMTRCTGAQAVEHACPALPHVFWCIACAVKARWLCLLSITLSAPATFTPA
jgi:hypothetical protein